MIELLRPLLELQELEKGLLDAKKQFSLCETNLVSTEALKQKLVRSLVGLKENFLQKKRGYQEGETTLEQLENLLVQQKARQVTVKKSEEFKALEITIHQTEEKISELQETLLNDLDELEALEKNLEAEKASTEEKLNELNKQQDQLQQQKLSCQTLIDEKMAILEAFERKLKGAFYEAYLTLRKCNKAIPRVVSVTEDGKCSGCFLTLSAELISKLDDAKTPQFCEHCGRILYR